ncbi:MAG: tRNA lysidine(34) synthetase TilS [Acidimicrobiales bacterium]
MTPSSGSAGSAPQPGPETTAPADVGGAAQDLTGELLARCRFPDPADGAVVCAVSGGADSLALLVLARAAGLAVTAVHVDHGLRPGSGAEAEVVAAAADRFGAGFRAERVSVPPGASLEERARLARRAVLGPSALTGHTADDQAETLLVNLLRGAGPAGLSAMRPGPPHPLLGLRRAETVSLCRHLGLQPVIDPSNDDPRFVRNRIRHEVLPLLADVSGRDPVPLLARTADHARAMADDLDTLAAAVDPTDCRALRAAVPGVAGAALRRWLRDERGHPPSSAELARVMAVVRNQATAAELAGGRRVSRSGGRLRMESRPRAE